MTTPSAVAVPSNLPQDLLFNAEKIDEAVSSSAQLYTDRLGISRSTVARWETGKTPIPKWVELAMRSI